MTTRPKRGRPALPDGEGKTSEIFLRVERARKAGYVHCANRRGQKLSAWILDALDRAYLQALRRRKI